MPEVAQEGYNGHAWKDGNVMNKNHYANGRTSAYVNKYGVNFKPFGNNFAQAQFATGMNGDEDLGQDIQMKGEPFHYQQAGSRAQFATGMNGDEDLGQDIQMKGEPFHYQQKPQKWMDVRKDGGAPAQNPIIHYAFPTPPPAGDA